MAVNQFNAAQYDNSNLMYQILKDNQARADANQQQNINNLTTLAREGVIAHGRVQEQDLRKANTDADGNLDEKNFISQLKDKNLYAGITAEYMLREKKGQELQLEKSKADLDINKQQAQSARLATQLQGVKFMRDLVGRANGQSGYDNAIAQAKKLGLDVSDYEGKQFTPEVKQQALNGLLSYDQELSAGIQKQNANVNEMQANNQAVYQAGQLKLGQQNANTDALQANNNAAYQSGQLQNQNKQLDISQQNADTSQVNATTAQTVANNNKVKAEATVNSQNVKSQQASLEKQTKVKNEVADLTSGFQGSAQTSIGAINLINGILNSPVFNSMAGGGLISTLRENIPGTEGANFGADIDTLKSQAFLESIKSMKGMGALSDAEGKKIAAALGSISYNTTPDKLRSTLQQINSRFNNFLQISKQEYNQKVQNYQQQLSGAAGQSNGQALQSNNNGNNSQSNQNINSIMNTGIDMGMEQ